ncbi:hypothetical protein BASA62_003411 [Batrachochytrium salamandrivorans]|nr:hypothetical protein BASA62_003411 [Batrachochytrium salamandrivorans]
MTKLLFWPSSNPPPRAWNQMKDQARVVYPHKSSMELLSRAYRPAGQQDLFSSLVRGTSWYRFHVVTLSPACSSTPSNKIKVARHLTEHQRRPCEILCRVGAEPGVGAHPFLLACICSRLARIPGERLAGEVEGMDELEQVPLELMVSLADCTRLPS